MQDLNQLRQQFQSLVSEHRDQEQQLRKEMTKHETQVADLISRYDDDMIKKQVWLIFFFIFKCIKVNLCFIVFKSKRMNLTR